ncbi:aldehyde dehydrogenase family protein [Aquabacterium sp.]|uniref:aldehyde dehydrogenase family protein n=1 Tax=Aquabacterium sp. TaxID=1872578 RepID=UPI003B699046
MDALKQALIVVDVQEDFLRRAGLTPDRESLIAQVSLALAGARAAGVPVIHVHTVVNPDLSHAMPHWQRADTAQCVRGTVGAQPPAALSPMPGERVMEKAFFSPFARTDLAATLQAWGIEQLIWAGLYKHACVRQGVLDAYAMGWQSIVLDDAVASPDVLHAELTHRWLGARAARFMPCRDWLSGAAQPAIVDRQVDDAVQHARSHLSGQSDSAARLTAWLAVLEREQSALISLMVDEVRKPIRDAREEFSRALAHLRSAMELSRQREHVLADGVKVRYRPHGCVALITPWNNPVAIPVGKLAPALAFGNAVVWKPAPECPRVSEALLQTLVEAGWPRGWVTMLAGDGRVGEALMRHAGVDAVSLTGSMVTGARARAICAVTQKPLQAELGGNNAAVVWPGCDVEQVAQDLAMAAFGYSGQRCTAVRRMIVHADLMAAFSERFVFHAQALPAGDLSDPQTVVAPLIHAHRVQRMQGIVQTALAQGASLLCGGQRAPTDSLRYEPTVLRADVSTEVYQQESFGPIAVISVAQHFDEAMAQVNAVPHGLIACLCGGSADEQSQFLSQAQAGMLRLGSRAWLHPDAPFAGWKGSAVGPPEHGRWDLEFYARPQAVYLPAS